MIVENNHGTRFLTMEQPSGNIIGVAADIWNSNIQNSFTVRNEALSKILVILILPLPN